MFEHGRDHGIPAERAVGDEGGADGVGQLLPALAGRVEHQRPGAFVAGQRGEVAGEDGLTGLGVGLLDDAPAPGVERGERLGGIPGEHRLDRLAGAGVGLADDLLQLERRHAGVLELAERAPGLDAAELGHVPDQHEPRALGVRLGEQPGAARPRTSAACLGSRCFSMPWPTPTTKNRITCANGMAALITPTTSTNASPAAPSPPLPSAATPANLPIRRAALHNKAVCRPRLLTLSNVRY